MDKYKTESDRSVKIREFVDRTGVSIEEAIRRLELANWDLEDAIYMYFDAEDEQARAKEGEEREAGDNPDSEETTDEDDEEDDNGDESDTSDEKIIQHSGTYAHFVTKRKSDAGKSRARKSTQIRPFSMPDAVGFFDPGDAPACSSVASTSGREMPRFATLDSLRLREERESHTSGDDSPVFYAGGSVNSGQQILEPERKRVKRSKKVGRKEKQIKEFIGDIFKSAMENGAIAGAVNEAASRTTSPYVTFRHKAISSSIANPSEVEADVVAGVKADVVAGVEAGIVTGMEADVVAGVEAGIVTGMEADVVAGMEADVVAGVESGMESGEEVGEEAEEAEMNAEEGEDVFVRIWRNGFNVDGGPLRNYNNEVNQGFLTQISRGILPASIRRWRHSDIIYLHIEDCSSEDYETPKKHLLPFIGIGHRLGSPTPNIKPNPELVESNIEKAEKVFKIDDKKPVTDIQVRLADGSRLMVHLNTTHTVRDLREYIVLVRPEYNHTIFSLVSCMSVELTNDSATLQEADLLNSVVFQRVQPE